MGGEPAPESLDTRLCSLSIIDPEPDCDFCKRRVDMEDLGLVAVKESSEELLRDRRALVRTRGFLFSAVDSAGDSMSGSYWLEALEGVLRGLSFQRSVLMMGKFPRG